MVDRGVVFQAPLLDKTNHRAAVNNTLEEVMKLFYVGIDWSDTQHRISIIDFQGAVDLVGNPKGYPSSPQLRHIHS